MNDRPVYLTVDLSGKLLLQERNEINEMIEIAKQFEVGGYYLVLDSFSVWNESEYFLWIMTSFASCDDILTVLIHLGYLAYDSNTAEVYIPNEEIRGAFSNAIQKCGWTAVIDAISASEKLLHATWRMDEAAAKGIGHNCRIEKVTG